MRGINQNIYYQDAYSKNDKYLSWKYPKFKKNARYTRNGIKHDIGSGLFATLLSALAFEVFENSDLVISVFRKNSGKNKFCFSPKVSIVFLLVIKIRNEIELFYQVSFFISF